MKLYARTAALALALSVSTPAMAQNLVQNGGFEAGDFTNWTIGNPTIYTSVVDITQAPGYGSGAYAGQFGTVGAASSLSQNLATTTGTNYTVSFTLRNDGGPENAFSALFGGNLLTSFTNVDAFGLTSYSFVSSAIGASTALTFNFRQDPSYFYIDDISVVENAVSAAPEPAAWALMILGFGAAGVTMRRSRKKVTVAYA